VEEEAQAKEKKKGAQQWRTPGEAKARDSRKRHEIKVKEEAGGSGRQLRRADLSGKKSSDRNSVPSAFRVTEVEKAKRRGEGNGRQRPRVISKNLIFQKVRRGMTNENGQGEDGRWLIKGKKQGQGPEAIPN